MESREVRIKELNAPRYSFADADTLAGVSRGTSRRWLKGYKYSYYSLRFFGDPDMYPPYVLSEEVRQQPPVGGAALQFNAASFMDLMEVLVISGLRSKGFSTRTVRQINEYCQLALREPRPLVTETFKVQGKDVFVQMSESPYLLNVSKQQGMHAWEDALDPFLESVDFEQELAHRWWPLGRNYPIVIDPDYGYGFPTVLETGVRTEIVAERARMKESVEEIAYDFDLTEAEIKAALEYEKTPLAA